MSEFTCDLLLGYFIVDVVLHFYSIGRRHKRWLP